MHFEQITSVDYQAVSHNEKQNVQFFLRSKKLRKTDNKVHRVQQISLLVILRNF